MKQVIFFLSVIFIVANAHAQKIDEQWVKEHYYKKEYKIEMRDGVKLFTCAYIPKNTSEKHPVLMVRTPYSCSPYGEEYYTPRLWNTSWKNFLKEDYILVIQDVRG